MRSSIQVGSNICVWPEQNRLEPFLNPVCRGLLLIHKYKTSLPLLPMDRRSNVKTYSISENEKGYIIDTQCQDYETSYFIASAKYA
jgi:hypothetical protein